jgi:hypothetical protein
MSCRSADSQSRVPLSKPYPTLSCFSSLCIIPAAAITPYMLSTNRRSETSGTSQMRAGRADVAQRAAVDLLDAAEAGDVH